MKMTPLVFTGIFLCIVYIVKSQEINNRWNLERYTWSRTHHDPTLRDKQVIDFQAIDNWVSLQGKPAISPDGKYISYGLHIGFYQDGMIDTLIVQSTDGAWRKSFTGVQPGFFSTDGKQYVYKEGDNGLGIVDLGGENKYTIKGITGYRKIDGNNEWLAWQLKDNEQTVVLYNLISKKERQYKNVRSFGFIPQCERFYCLVENSNSSGDLFTCRLSDGKERKFDEVKDVNFSSDGKHFLIKDRAENIKYLNESGTYQIIWSPAENEKLTTYSFDKSGTQVVLMVQNQGKSSENFGQLSNSIWYWQAGMVRALMKVRDQASGIDVNMKIQESSALFSYNGRYIEFKVFPVKVVRPTHATSVKVDIWSYRDGYPQLIQERMSNEPPRQYACILNIANGQIFQLEKVGQEISSPMLGDFVVVGDVIGNDLFWKPNYYKVSNWLVSLKDGSRQLLPVKGRGAAIQPKFNPQFNCSSDGRWLVYYDVEKGHYFSFDAQSGEIKNISYGMPAFHFGVDQGNRYIHTKELPNQCYEAPPNPWVGDHQYMVYDEYDIWLLNLTGKRPVNITNGYANHIQFDISGKGDNTGQRQEHDTLLLEAFNTHTEENGFYRKVLGNTSNPEKLFMDACFVAEVRDLGKEQVLIKAKRANVWLVQKEKATVAPNYYITSDFKNFKQITHVQPEKNYNWYTSTMHKFKQMDGTSSQGILYKPDNFDPRKKYPVIISFYTSFSGSLNYYTKAGYMQAPLIFEPGWLVSQGYLVFTPDIYFTQGKWGPSTVNTVDGAARYLATLPYVDAPHLGAVGHSNSGRFGFYLLTHSKSFAAMSVGEGSTDIISMALAGSKWLYWAEENAQGTGLGNLWKNKQSWLDHTSVLSADKVTSPLLLFDNKAYDNVSIEEPIYSASQAEAMYMSLRRLEKKSWWVHYPIGGHTLGNLDELRDYSIRYIQFFDHYLKEAPAPRWMTEGIAFEDKGTDAKYELDPMNSCGSKGVNNCNVCNAWNKQYLKTPEMFAKEIKDWKLHYDVQKELDRMETERHRKSMIGEEERIKENNRKLKEVLKK